MSIKKLSPSQQILLEDKSNLHRVKEALKALNSIASKGIKGSKSLLKEFEDRIALNRDKSI